jgi:hypothetical protein
MLNLTNAMVIALFLYITYLEACSSQRDIVVINGSVIDAFID